MATDSIEREILIEASPEVVWQVITDPDQITQWFADEAEVDATPGADGKLTWKPGGRGGAEKDGDVNVPIRVVDAEPFRRFSFRWNNPEGARPVDSNSALVEFTLIEQAGGTLLKVLESGIDLVTNAETVKSYLSSHEEGWGRHLGELRDHVLAMPGGARP